MKLEKGDYVLVTKWGDGCPGDHWFVGFFDEYDAVKERYHVIDNQGKSPRGNGFRRIKKITQKRGQFILDNMENIEMGSRSLWLWARCSMKSN